MSLSVPGTTLLPASPETIDKIQSLEDVIRKYPQIEFVTEHILHAGMYSRTVRIPANVIFTNVLIKCPTMLILNGTVDLTVGDMGVRLQGYNVLACEAGRKQVYVTRTAVDMTMIFPSNAMTVEEAEAEFTDEAHHLLSQTNENHIVITGVPCQASQRPPLC